MLSTTANPSRPNWASCFSWRYCRELPLGIVALVATILVTLAVEVPPSDDKTYIRSSFPARQISLGTAHFNMQLQGVWPGGLFTLLRGGASD